MIRKRHRGKTILKIQRSTLSLLRTIQHLSVDITVLVHSPTLRLEIYIVYFRIDATSSKTVQDSVFIHLFTLRLKIKIISYIAISSRMCHLAKSG